MANVKAVWLLSIAAILNAQQSATLRGVLTDTSGAVIPAATVLLTQADSGERQTAQTIADGSYSFTGLAAGKYTLKLMFPGFEPFETSISVAAPGTTQVPVQLTLQTGRQEVTVSGGSAPELSTDSDRNASALVVGGADLDALPDDPADLSDMLAQLAGPAAGSGGGPQILLDGFSGGQLPPKAAIKEIRVNQNPFSAEYDSPGFGRIEIITKPGADNFRGGAGITDSDAIFNSRNPYAENKAGYVNRMFTGNLAGPVTRRASFSLNLYRSKIDNTALIDAVTLDPSTYAPLPVRSTVLTPRDDIGLIARIDHQLTTNSTLTGSYQHSRSNRDNNGIGQYSLISRAYSSETRRDDVRLTETTVLNPNTVNDTRFAYSRALSDQFGNNTVASVMVAAAFNGGGAQAGNSSNLYRQFEGQNNTTVIRAKHTVRFGVRARRISILDISPANFGGTFSFFGVSAAPVLDSSGQIEAGSDGLALTAPIGSLEQYRRTLLGLPGGGASQFSIAGGNPVAKVDQTDFGVYAMDEWRVKPNFMISLGLRYENQTNIGDERDFGPRAGFAWSPGTKDGTAPKTVIRAGAGMFYNRVSPNITLQASRFNGVNQQQFVVQNPSFYPAIPSLATLEAGKQPASTYMFDPRIRAAAWLDGAVTLERQLPWKTTLSATYLNAWDTHLMTTVNINTPLPGTGARPYGNDAGNLFLFESVGVLRLNNAWVEVNSHPTAKISLSANYQWLSARSDVDSQSPPSNPYDLKQDWGHPSWMRAHNLSVYGTLMLPFKIQMSPFAVAASGAPYNLTTGTDLNGDTIAGDRPAFATVLSRPSVVFTRFGAFDTSPIPGQKIVPYDYLTGNPMWNLNLRVSRTFDFGAVKTGGDRRFHLNFNVDANNVLNHLNQGGYVGNLSSPLFGQSTSIYLFRDTSNNRRVQLGTQLTF